MGDKIAIIKKETDNYPIFLEQLENIGYDPTDILEFGSISDPALSHTAAVVLFMCIDSYSLFLDEKFEQSLKPLSHIPVVALSSVPDTEHMEMAMLNGIEDYLVAGTFDEHLLHKTIVCAVARKKKQVLAGQQWEQKIYKERAQFDSLQDAFYTVDNDWNFTFINKECERLYNINRDELIGTSWRALFSESRAKRFYQEYETAVEQQSSVHFKAFAPNASKWVQVNAYPSKEGLAIFQRDISEQKLLEEKIGIEKQNLIATINNTTDMVWSVDKDFKIISANSAFKRFVYQLCGVQLEEGACFLQQCVNTGIVKRWENHYQQALTGPFSVIDEDTLNGVSFYTETFFSPITSTDGLSIGVSCFSRDMSQQRERSRQIQSQRDRLREIAWMQSHQVRGPISTILGLAQFFNSADHSDPINTQVIDGIVETTNELDGIIREIVKRTYEIVPENSLEI